MRKALIFAVLTLCIPMVMFGMPQMSSASVPNSAPWPPPPPAIVAAFLDFTPAQADQFQALLGPFLDTLQALEVQKQEREQALQQLLSAPNPIPPVIGVLVLQIHALDQQQGQAIQAFHQAFVSLLTPGQLQKVELVVQAAQVVPVLGAFEATYLIAPPSAAASSAPAKQ
jgi:Spy/CpxP family protein refolding chaperone